MKNILFLLSCSLFFFSACSNKAKTAGHPEFNASEAFELGVGNTKKMNGDDFIIEFVEVKQESRCPEGVNCIRAGEVIVVVNINGNSHTLTKTPNATAKKTIDRYALSLLEVSPYPKNKVVIDKAEYSLTLEVKKL